MRLVTPTALMIAATTCAACTPAEAKVSSHVRMDHGIEVGARITPTDVECLSGGRRSVGAKDEVQIVTFTTPFDCSECTPHLAGVPKVVKAAGLSKHAFWVVWAPNMRSVERSVSLNDPGLPVCVDARGALWDQHDLLHTPFTAVIRNGTVVYMHDGLVSREADERQLAQDLGVLFAGKSRRPPRSNSSGTVAPATMRRWIS